MAWTTPKTDWNNGELITAGDMNAVGENLNILKETTASENLPRAVGTTTQHINRNSGSFVDIDSENLNLTITTQGGDVLVHFDCSVRHSDGSRGATVYFDVNVDGSLLGTGWGIMENKMDVYYHNVSFTRLLQNLSAGSHTFKMQWKENSGGGRGARLAPHAQFWVREI